MTKDIPADGALIATLRVVGDELKMRSPPPATTMTSAADVDKSGERIAFSPTQPMRYSGGETVETPPRRPKNEPEDDASSTVTLRAADDDDDERTVNVEAKFVPPPLLSKKKDRQMHQMSPLTAVPEPEVDQHRRTYCESCDCVMHMAVFLFSFERIISIRLDTHMPTCVCCWRGIFFYQNVCLNDKVFID